MMLKRLLLFLLCAWCVSVSGQQIRLLEYWADNDMSSRQSVQPSATGSFAFEIDAESLAPGIHTLTLRVQDDGGQWGSPHTHYFVRIPPASQSHEVTHYEYWFDNNTAARQSVAGDVLSLDVSADTLACGIHTLSYRSLDSGGRWSAPQTHYFVRLRSAMQSHETTRYEYWFDNNTAARQSVAGDVLSLDLTTDTLSRGIHTLTVRAQDNDGRWSAPAVHYFVCDGLLAEGRIVGLQYWFNDAFANATYREIDATEPTVAVSLNLRTRDLLKREPAEGETADDASLYIGVENVLHYRFKDANGAWGQIESSPFVYMGDDGGVYLDVADWQLMRQAHEMTGGDSWTAKWQFGKSADEPVDLAGVSIDDDGHVTIIDVADCNLTGPFPTPLLQLPALHTLLLANNHLEGDLCQDLGDDQQARALHAVDISGNRLSGNVGLFAAHCPQLRSLHAQGNCLQSVEPGIAPEVTDLRLQAQTIAAQSTLHIGHLSADSLLVALPSIVTYNHQLRQLTPDVRLQWSTADGAWQVAMSYADGLFALSPLSADRIYRGANGDVLSVTVADDHHALVKGTTFPMSLRFDAGDGNLDGDVNVLDLQTTINVILETHGDRLFNHTAANLWNDEKINVQDAVALVNLLLASEPQQSRLWSANGGRRSASADEAVQAAMTIDGSKLLLSTTQPVAAFDLFINRATSFDVASELSQMGFVCTTRQTDRGIRLIAYSLSGATLPMGLTVLGSVEGAKTGLSSAVLASADAQSVSVLLNATVTGLLLLSDDAADDAGRYDLQGRKADRRRLKNVYIQQGQKVVGPGSLQKNEDHNR